MAQRLLTSFRMNTSAIAPVPPEIAPAPPRANAASAASFGALLAPKDAPALSAEKPHGVATTVKAAVSNARAERAPSDKKSSNDNAGSTAAVAPQPLQQAPRQTSATPTTPAPAPPAATTSAANIAPILLAATPAAAASDLPGAAADSASAVANSAAAQAAAPPTSATSTTPSSTAIPFAAMAAQLGARIAAGAPGLTSQPRVALADLAAPQDKLAAAASNSHSALSLEALQGSAKPPTLAGAAIDEKLLADAAKEVAVAATSLERAATDSAANQQPTTGAALADTSASVDAAAAPAVAPPTPTPIAAAPAPLSPTMLRAAEQVALALPQAVKSGDGHIQIQLQPAELGAIDVKLNVNHDGRVTMVVSADRGDTLNLLRQDSGTLTQALRDAGLQADSSSLSFNLRGGFAFNQQSFNGGAAPGGAIPSPSDHEPGDITLPPGALQRRHAGSLDIHV